MSDDLQAKLDELAALREQGVLSEAAYRAAVAAERAEAAKTLGERAVDAAAADIDGSVIPGRVEAGHFAGRDLNLTVIAADTAAAFWGQFRRPAPDLEKATQRYLTYLAGRYLYLDFKGMGVTDRAPLRLPLAEMYVPVKARIEMPKGETWARELKLAGRAVSAEEAAAMGQRLSEPRPVLELVGENDGLIILGDPGAGKTTFLKFLALQLALGRDVGLGTRLPVLLPLAAYANALAEADVPLHRFIARYYRNMGIDEPLDQMLSAALDEGRVLLLLDGLDEVQDLGRRSLVVERVLHFFTYRRAQGNKFVLTSRIVGYRDVRPSETDMAECTLVDFDEEEIALFIGKWTAAVEQQAQAGAQFARRAAAEEEAALLAAVRQNPGVRRLAANPLLLTILALMKRQGVVLPDRRVELYDRYVTTLLKHWNVARGLGRPPARDLDVVETIRVLAPLALWIHETNPGAGLAKREDVRRELVAIYRARQMEHPEALAGRLLRDARAYANLLLERGAGQYGFIHLTFQEYLAAVAIAQRGQRGIRPIVDKLAAHVGDDNWREVLLLTIGYIGLIQQMDQRAGAVLRRLVESAPGPPGQAAILAGEAAADAGVGGVPAADRKFVREALITTLGDAAGTSPGQRIRAGQTLARVGDPRPEVTGIAAMPFCLIPRGPFWMGSGDDDEAADDDEKPGGRVDVPYDYWLGQFPVTNAQYAAFVAAGGYEEARYWPEAAAHEQWREGQIKDWQGGRRTAPYAWGVRFRADNQPVVGVTWYEAMAFCRWLAEQLPEAWTATLPGEAEWEKGARGGIELPAAPATAPLEALAMANLSPAAVDNPAPRRLYPWGARFDPDRVNYKENGDGPSAPGCFPGGVSPSGLLDMSGNVYEWTRAVWGFDYPYRAEDGREELDSKKNRVLRGGSWRNDKAAVLRCAYRRVVDPDDHSDINGFRVCVRPHSHL